MKFKKVNIHKAGSKEYYKDVIWQIQDYLIMREEKTDKERLRFINKLTKDALANKKLWYEIDTVGKWQLPYKCAFRDVCLVTKQGYIRNTFW